MHNLLVIWLAVSLALLAATWVGYPLLMWALARLRPRPFTADPRFRPTLSVIVPARDEAAVLPRKLASLAAQQWPVDRLEVIVVDDGSSDDTAAVAGSFRGLAVHCVSTGTPSGKAVALQVGVAVARGEVLVLTDARQPLCAGALEQLVAPLADASVGAVSGELALLPGGGGLGLYRRLDDALRRCEARSGSCVGVTGALWAMRRALWAPLRPGTILDDLLQPLVVARRGRRVVVAPGARVEDAASPDPRRELGRRARTLAGNFQLLRDQRWVLSWAKNPLLPRLFGHKLLRLLAPAALGGVALASALLARAPDATAPRALVAAQLGGYGLALLAPRSPWPLSSLARLCRAFVVVHFAVLLGAWSVLRRQEALLWRAPRPSPAASGTQPSPAATGPRPSPVTRGAPA